MKNNKYMFLKIIIYLMKEVINHEMNIFFITILVTDNKTFELITEIR